MNTKDLIRLGVPVGEPIALAHEFIQNFIAQGKDGALLEAEIFNIVANPPAFFADELRAPLARAIYRPAFTPRAELAPWRREHDVMDEDWSVSPVTQRLRDKAWSQLGTNGSGNHFVEFGAFTVPAVAGVCDPGTGLAEAGYNLEPGEYLALLTHSGSRGTGAQVCDFYSKRAMARHEHLPKDEPALAGDPREDARGGVLHDRHRRGHRARCAGGRLHHARPVGRLAQAARPACDLTQQTFYILATKGHQMRDRSKVTETDCKSASHWAEPLIT
jgi:hypothetical protein